jgi:hypothetical protein
MIGRDLAKARLDRVNERHQHRDRAENEEHGRELRQAPRSPNPDREHDVTKRR